ncbi:MAG: hypothetical protein V7776_08110 [Halopseudomonas aestusnigri]
MSRPGDKGERSIALFLLALLLFSPLILSIFNKEDLFFGLPPLYAYLFSAWGGIIAAVGWSAWRGRDKLETAELDKDVDTASYPVTEPEVSIAGDPTRPKPSDGENVSGDSDAG